MKLYHYNAHYLDALLTRDLQGLVDEEEKKDGMEAAKFRGDPGPYYDSVSFLLEPAPLDIISSIFPDDHHTWRAGKKLFEHVVDLENQDFYGWVIVEGPVSMLFVDHIPWSENPFYKKLFFSAMSTGRKLFNESGKNHRSLKRALDKIPPGTTRQAYKDIPKRKDYENIKTMYAATVPHLMVYTKSPIQIKSVKQVEVAKASMESNNVNFPTLHFPISSNW